MRSRGADIRDKRGADASKDLGEEGEWSVTTRKGWAGERRADLRREPCRLSPLSIAVLVSQALEGEVCCRDMSRKRTWSRRKQA